jgi:hypothetical protein
MSEKKSWHWVHASYVLAREYVHNTRQQCMHVITKRRTILMGYSGAQKTLIHEKNWSRKSRVRLSLMCILYVCICHSHCHKAKVGAHIYFVTPQIANPENLSRGLQPWRSQDDTLGRVREIWTVWLILLITDPWPLLPFNSHWLVVSSPYSFSEKRWKLTCYVTKQA